MSTDAGADSQGKSVDPATVPPTSSGNTEQRRLTVTFPGSESIGAGSLEPNCSEVDNTRDSTALATTNVSPKQTLVDKIYELRLQRKPVLSGELRKLLDDMNIVGLESLSLLILS